FIVVAGATAMAAGADPDGNAAAKPAILDPLGMFKSKSAPAPARSALDVSKEIQPATIDPKELAARRAREMANYLRRLEVCLELHDIAEQTGDAVLEHTASQLE